MSETAEQLSFEEALAELEIVAELESGDMTLEASLDLFEKGKNWLSSAMCSWKRPLSALNSSPTTAKS